MPSYLQQSFTQAMKFSVLEPVRSAMVWPWPQTVAKSTSCFRTYVCYYNNVHMFVFKGGIMGYQEAFTRNWTTC